MYSVAQDVRTVSVSTLLLNTQSLTVIRKQKGDTYPTEEIEWMATTTFNRAVDFFGASDDAASKRWAEKALSIAALNDDGGALHRTLQSKFLTLSWDE